MEEKLKNLEKTIMNLTAVKTTKEVASLKNPKHKQKGYYIRVRKSAIKKEENKFSVSLQVQKLKSSTPHNQTPKMTTKSTPTNKKELYPATHPSNTTKEGLH